MVFISIRNSYSIWTNGSSYSGNYIYIDAGVWWVKGWCIYQEWIASDTADNCSMWIGKNTNLNGQYVVGSANAIGDWNTTIFGAKVLFLVKQVTIQ